MKDLKNFGGVNSLFLFFNVNLKGINWDISRGQVILLIKEFDAKVGQLKFLKIKKVITETVLFTWWSQMSIVVCDSITILRKWVGKLQTIICVYC